jgi:NitT/TauT family transport system substrate-binding protein
MNTFEHPQRIRLMDTYRNLFYTPIYVAVGGGFLYQSGLDVMFGTVPPGKSAMHMLRDGEVDIIQTGISRSLMELDEGREDAPIHIAEANQRDGFFIVSNRLIDGWTWKHLEGASLIPVGFTPVPMMSLKAVLNKHCVDAGMIRLIEGLSAQDALQKFRDGEADYIHMVHPQAEQLIEDGVGYLAAPIGTELGYICYSSFAVTPYGEIEGRVEDGRTKPEHASSPSGLRRRQPSARPGTGTPKSDGM